KPKTRRPWRLRPPHGPLLRRLAPVRDHRTAQTRLLARPSDMDRPQRERPTGNSAPARLARPLRQTHLRARDAAILWELEPDAIAPRAAIHRVARWVQRKPPQFQELPTRLQVAPMAFLANV